MALSATKDVQDAILTDALRSAVVDVIDFKYWWQSDKGLYDPKGGQNLSPRQHDRYWKNVLKRNMVLAKRKKDFAAMKKKKYN